MKSDDTFKRTAMVLGILLVLSVGYIAFDKYKTSQETQLLTAYQDGYNRGVQEAVVSLYQQTNNCQGAVINLGNVTREVFDTACLQNAQQ